MIKHSTKIQKSRRRAAKADLNYVNAFDEGIARRRCGRGFTYFSARGRRITSQRTRKRLQDLVIPPAWEDVWICPTTRGHIQARGRDEAGRIQYIYHEDWQAVSSSTKFSRMVCFGEALPRIRRRVRRDLNREGLPRSRVLAAVVRLLDKTHLRVGNDQSVKARGATTLGDEHVSLTGFRVKLEFPGKSNQHREVELFDRKVAAVIRRCEELDGQYLFSYDAGEDTPGRVCSTDVNAYLREISKEDVSAKDFRTWWGSVTALGELNNLSNQANGRQRKSAVRVAIKSAAAALGNTVAVCRNSYVHPGMVAAAAAGDLPGLLLKCHDKTVAELKADEVRFQQLLPQLDVAEYS